MPSPTREGAWCLRAAARALRIGLSWLSAYIRGYQPLSLSYFLIVDSGPPGSGPLKDQQEEKGMTEDEMVGWHQRLNGHEFE